MSLPPSPSPRRALRLCKSICWVLLFAGAGTLAFYAMILLTDGWELSHFEFLLPIAALMTMLVSGAVLFWSYKAEPANFAGFWHLSLADLLAATFFTALTMSVFRSIWPENFSRVGVFTTLAMGLGFTFCLLLAARRGCVSLGLKVVCAFGTFMTALGMMVAGFFVFILTFSAIVDQRIDAIRSVFLELFFLKEPTHSGDDWFFNLVRIGILMIPIGIIIRRAVARQLAPERDPGVSNT